MRKPADVDLGAEIPASGMELEAEPASDLARIRAAIVEAGAPPPVRSFTREEMVEAIGQAVEARFARHHGSA